MSTNAGFGPPLVKTSRKRLLVRDSTTDLNSSGHRPLHAKKKVRVGSTVNSSSPFSILRDKNVNSITHVEKRTTDAAERGVKEVQEGCIDIHATTHKPPGFASLIGKHLLENDLMTDDPDISRIEKLMKPEDIAPVISRRGWWTVAILGLFSQTSITELCLSKSLSSSSSATSTTVLGVFIQQLNGFEHLQTLSLSKISLSLEDIACLRMLPCIKALDLAATHITTRHLLHLATHANTLERLNIASNSAIDDDSRVPLSALQRLQAISLRETSITLPCLRLLAYCLPQACRFMTVPSTTLEYLNSRARRYSVQIPQGLCSDPRQIPELNVGALKRNLELHKRLNSDITTTGSKAELVARLTTILCNRVADEKIANRVGRA